MIATTCELPLHPLPQCTPRQSHESLHRSLTRPTACSLCCPQMTIAHRIESLASPFFGAHLHASGYPSVFLIDIGLQPLLRNLGCTSDSSQGNAFQQQSVNQFPSGLVDHFFSRLFDELPPAVSAFEPLFSVMNATILNRIGRSTQWASRHGRTTAKNSTSLSLHLWHYRHLTCQKASCLPDNGLLP